MPDKIYDTVKKEIRSVLLTFQEGVLLEQFLKTYRGLLGERLPSRTCGFSSDIAFLQSMPDVVSVTTNAQGRVHLTAIADKTSLHIQRLVSKQRKSKQSSAKSKKRQPFRKLPGTLCNVSEQKSFHKLPDTLCNVSEQKPFLPGPLKAEILQLMASYRYGVTIPGFALAYRRKFNRHLPLVKGLDTLEEMVNLIPDLELRIEGKDKMIYVKDYSASNGNKEMDEAPRCKNLMEENLRNIHTSGVPEDVLQDFQLILQKCSDGILSIHFPVLYENITGKQFDLHSLGYNSLADLVDTLPHIFYRTLDPTNPRQWIILPAKASLNVSNAENLTAPNQKNISPYSQEGIPADVSSPTLQFFQPNLPEDLTLNEYVEVFISAILDPSQFWFQLQTDKAVKKFEELEKDMENFYNFSAGDDYKMKTVDIAIGSTCVIQCPDDDQWYRAVIKSIPSIDQINVYFVDYGSRQNVPRKNIYYVRSKYHEFPACAFKAQLAGLKPPNNESLWNIQARRRFVQLCNTPVIMAYIISSDKETYSVYLCDTSGETDIHLDDTLIEEGLAEICLQNQLSVNNNNLSHKNYVTCKGNGALVNSESNPSSCSDMSTPLSDSSEACSRPNISTPRKKLSFSAEGLSDDKPNCSNFETEKVKRYVKTVELWQNTVMHIINIENKLFMSCGELSRYLWSDGTSSSLMQRLLYKEVEIPFLKLKEEDNVELFKQCRWSKIPDMEELDSWSSSLILCPLKQALKVLNVFGHPSAVLRMVIQSEIKNFDPYDPIWKQFEFEEPFDWDDTEKYFLQELNTLCLYNLKARHEALKIKRLKLLKKDSAVAVEERKRIEKLQSIIKKRMQQIEEICAQYPS